jgi:hypothetical protein
MGVSLCLLFNLLSLNWAQASPSSTPAPRFNVESAIQDRVNRVNETYKRREPQEDPSGENKIPVPPKPKTLNSLADETTEDEWDKKEDSKLPGAMAEKEEAEHKGTPAPKSPSSKKGMIPQATPNKDSSNKKSATPGFAEPSLVFPSSH